MNNEKGLPTAYQHFIFLSRYSRWIETQKRRETWEETVERYIDFFKKRYPETLGIDYDAIKESILVLDTMPSMRCLWTAGKALAKDEASGYNCSFLPMDSIRSFSELFFCLLLGTGVGFSVERQYINKLPQIPEDVYPSETIIIIKDSKMGWVQGLNELISLLYSGRIPKWDLTLVRPAGARLKTFGGRASGPEPLKQLFQVVVQIFKRAAGRRLNSIEAHTLCCSIASAVLVGGVRRCWKKTTTFVQMNDGSWKLGSEIKVGDQLRMPDNTSAQVTNIFDNGNQEIVKVHLEDGTYFECTPEHRWLVYNHQTDDFEWIQTKYLDKGEYSMIYPKEFGD